MADIAQAAIGLATAGGLDAVSMRAVAGELGTTASALYRYVRSRDELLDLMVDTAMAGFAPAHDPDEHWLAACVRLAHATLDLYLGQPWLLDAHPAKSSPGPNTLAWFDHCLRAMASLDRPTMAKMEAIGLLNGVVILFARNALAPAAIDFGAMSPDRHPALTAALANATPGQATGDLFERAIRALLTGLLA